MHHPLPRSGAAALAFQGVAHAQGLPGFIADSLPDGWGMLLMDRALRKLGRDPRRVSVLERLAIVGERAMGAFSFEPSEEDILPNERLELKALAKQVIELQADESLASDEAEKQLRHLMQLGGSPQGARPKVLVDFNTRTGQVSSGLPLQGSASPWLVKFPAQTEHREVCAVEELYARLARSGGMQMPKSSAFGLGAKYAAFGVERFDRVVLAKGKERGVIRVPIMSMAAYLQADYRLPSLDYETVLLATLQITGDQREVIKAFDRCIFNVIMHNRDDHAKNFAFRMDEQGLWKLSPAFDLTYSFGPGGEHSTSVAGHGRNITREHLLKVAKTAGIAARIANERIDHWCGKLKSLKRQSDGLAIRRSTLNELQQSLLARIGLIVSSKG
jgi:serine/threonine-protein kinase HipA